MRLTHALPALAAGILMVGGCSEPAALPSTPSPAAGASLSAPDSRPVPVPPPAPVRYHLNGLVTTEGGAPIAGAGLWVEYASGFRYTQTNGRGEYELEFDARPLQNSPQGHVGYIYAFSDVHEMNLQWVPLGGDRLVQNFVLRPRRIVAAGDAATVSVGLTSSRCKDLEDLHSMEHRCEILHVESPGAGTLDVELRAGGGVTPVLMWATSGDYTGPVRLRGQSSGSFAVHRGTIRIFVGIPDGSTERIDVVTALQ